jgi:hypothetical protein
LRSLGKRDPTSRFAPSAFPLALVYDVETARMSGISYSSSVGELSLLGPASEADWGFSDSYLTLQYDDHGLLIELDDRGVVSYEVSFAKSQPLGLGPVIPRSCLAISLSDRSAVVALGTTTALLDSMLGQPYDRFNFSTGELCSQYTVGGSHFIATHSADGQVLLHFWIAEAAIQSSGAVA